ncbi:hypothetical protein KY285_000589 [Solanum tuberosum]|nr:hypothetical protein KY285_000589 [Solanum tuberosum]
MVTIPHPYLQVWWKFMNAEDKKNVQRHIGHLPSLMEMVAYPDLIGTMVKFWDIDNMVFRFGKVELTPTIDKVLASFESVGMCNKRKHQPDTDLLFPKIWDFTEIKENLSLVKAEWIDRLPGMLPLWKTRRVLGEPVPNRFRPECSKDYKERLKKSLVGTIEPGPNVPHMIADVGAKHQIRLHRLQEKYNKNELDHQCRHSEDARIIAQLEQKLRRARQCISELDDSMEHQI